MGRGRQKAKHTKVARELKYFSPDTNYNELARELGSDAPAAPSYEQWADDDTSDYEDKYADVYGDEDESDEAESKSA